MKKFDRQFGPDFIKGLPVTPGVYLVYDENKELIYVGKAKNLKRRLSQYRNAKRGKKDRRMVNILKEAVEIKWQTCSTDLDSCLLETETIQQNRPKWNIVHAFSHRYPYIGLAFKDDRIFLAMTTKRECFPEYEFYGAFRSREIVAEGFFAIMRLFRFLGRAVPRKALEEQMKTIPPRPKSYIVAFDRIPRRLFDEIGEFLGGKSRGALDTMVGQLLEKKSARARAGEIQNQIEFLRIFYEMEAEMLNQALEVTGHEKYPVEQEERDPLFLRFRDASKGVST